MCFTGIMFRRYICDELQPPLHNTSQLCTKSANTFDQTHGYDKVLCVL